MSDDLRTWVASRQWYHTIELAPGIETPGWFDHRDFAQRIPWGDLRGRRCLDVGTFDGFWAFEMERRGGQVTTVDELDPQRWDWPAGSDDAVKAAIYERHQGGAAFERVKELVGSEVERRYCNVYDLSPERVGRFEVVYVGSILLHLRDPIRALEAVRSVAEPGARIIMVDAIDLELTLAFPSRPIAQLEAEGRPWWWKPNLAGLAQFARAANLTVEGRPRRVFLKPGRGQPTSWPRPRHALTRRGRELAVLHAKGDPHGIVVARA